MPKHDPTECAAISRALRDAGFVKLPPLWVRGTDMPRIHRIAHRYSDQVNAVRAQVREDLQRQADPDPVSDKESAWDQFDRLRYGS